MSSRRKARILAFQTVYAWEISHAALHEILEFSWMDPEKLEGLDEESLVFTRLLAAGTVENIIAIDAEIGKHLQHWTFERLKRVDLAILRVSAYSLLFQTDIPPQITIDEAIEIAKEYGAEDSYRFVNGILDAVWKSNQSIVSSRTES